MTEERTTWTVVAGVQFATGEQETITDQYNANSPQEALKKHTQHIVNLHANPRLVIEYVETWVYDTPDVEQSTKAHIALPISTLEDDDIESILEDDDIESIIKKYKE